MELIFYVLRNESDPHRYTRLKKRRKSSRGKCRGWKVTAVGRHELGFGSFEFKKRLAYLGISTIPKGIE